jgi:hypothetical protein
MDDEISLIETVSKTIFWKEVSMSVARGIDAKVPGIIARKSYSR